MKIMTHSRYSKQIALLLSVLLLIQVVQALAPSVAAADFNDQSITQQQVTDTLLALQDEYPEGTPWTNNSPNPAYVWRFKGSVVSMGGCAAFAAILQDRVFGSIVDVPVTWQRITEDCAMAGVHECPVPYTWEYLWPGDILQFPGHTVIVIQKMEDSVIIAEGNNGGTVRWGRKISKAGVSTANYVLTRYSKYEPLMPYTDLPEDGHWSHDAVSWAILKHVAEPICANRFGPEEHCSRAEMVFFLWRTMGSPEPELSYSPFMDLKHDTYYYKAVLWAAKQGITTGTSPTTFSPDELCTRAQALTFLWRAEGSPKDGSKSIGFEDVAISDYYYSTVAWAYTNNITCGTSTSTFSPDKEISRAEALTFLFRADNA